MKTTKLALLCASAIAATAILSGCETTSDSGPSAATAKSTSVTLPVRYKATDGRDIEIGHARADHGGLRFDEPHMEKNKCWIADGFNFKGYNTLYIAPIVPDTKIHDDERPIQDIAIQNLTAELKSSFAAKGFFPKISTSESDLKPGALRLDLTITEYHKGGGAARYFAGLYGAGQPVLKVHGVATDNGKTVFDFEMRRSGASAQGRMGGGFMKDEDVQMGDIHSLVLDLTDFMAAISGKYTPEN